MKNFNIYNVIVLVLLICGLLFSTAMNFNQHKRIRLLEINQEKVIKQQSNVERLLIEL